MSRLHRKLERDCNFLKVDELPKEKSGVEIRSLDYEGDSSDDEKKLTDDDVKRLADALANSSQF